MTSAPLVIVDDRERDFMPKALAEYGLQVSVSRLDYGDYRWFPHGLTVALELNSVSDMLNKLKSKRLVAQVQGLASVADLSFVMIRGRYDEDNGQVAYKAPTHPGADSRGWVRSGWGWDSFQAIKTDIMLLGIHFIDCPNEGDAAREISRLVTNLSKDTHKWLRERTRPEVLTLDGQYRNSVWALSAFSGIGPETAEAMLKGEDSSVASLVARAKQVANGKLSLESFCKDVDGLGPKRAKKFIEEVTQSWE